jgi:hypothetical protein
MASAPVAPAAHAINRRRQPEEEMTAAAIAGIAGALKLIRDFILSTNRAGCVNRPQCHHASLRAVKYGIVSNLKAFAAASLGAPVSGSCDLAPSRAQIYLALKYELKSPAVML